MAWIKQTIVCLFLLSALLPVQASAAQNRLALVIGNSDYDESALRNPKNDANDMAEVLDTLGFDVTLALDLDGVGMDKTIRQFGQRLKENKGIAFFYYAGHGVQVEGNNYLIPVDSNIGDEDEIRFKSIAVESVLQKMQRANDGLNILVLDACRNNPFPSSFRSTSRGLARLDAPAGSIVVYSTSPGTVSEDGKGRNGTFTGHFLKHLKQPGLTLTQTIRRTRKAVRAETNNKQNPWASSNLIEDEYVLLPSKSNANNNANNDNKSSPIEVETVFWNSVSIGHTVDEYAAYIAAYPAGQFINLAKTRMQMLQNRADQQLTLNTQTTQNNQAKSLTDNVVALLDNEQSKTVEFTVNVTPDDARVRIMNIVDKYRPGIPLAKGQQYDIFVQKQGYKPWRENVFVDQFTTSLDVDLIKIGQDTPVVAPATHVRPGDRGWRLIQPAQYSMGCSKGDRLCKTAEKPVKTVYVQPYMIAETEVTVGDFRRFVSATGYQSDAHKNAGGYTGCYIRTDKGGISRDNARWNWQAGASWEDPGFSQTDDHPVTCVSWNDAVTYAKWLSRELNQSIRLPTEAEWEYAVRAGSSKRFGPTSSSRNLCDFENGADKSKSPSGASWTDKLKCSDGYWNTAPVKSFKSNQFGLYDMLGNVREWTLDVWQAKLPSETNSGIPNRDGTSDERVLRGGAWDGNATKLRVSARSRGYRASRASITGFRLVKEPGLRANK